MEETQTKRLREPQDGNYCEEAKRHKSYMHILSILEEEEEEEEDEGEEPANDLLLDIFTILQQELLCDPFPNPTQEPDRDHQTVSPALDQSRAQLKDGGEDDGESVIKHLLEASDDELGIPEKTDGGGGDEDGINGWDPSMPICDGLWELEDEAAYYSLLQSELFI